jgi:hypothetical protein
MPRCLGTWQAYVEQGETKDIQLERLKEVPGKFRNDVIRHVRAVNALNKAKVK